MSDIKLKIGGKNTPGRSNTLRWMLYIFVGLFALLVVAYFVVTSSGFLKRFVLPRVGAALKADISAGEISLSPFSRLVLRDVKLTPKGEETLLTVREARVRYSLTAWFGGRIEVGEIFLDSPTVTLVEKPDSKSNLDPLLKSSSKTAAPAKPAPTPSVSVSSVVIKDGTLRQTKKLAAGWSDTIEVTQLSLKAADIRNGQPGKFELGGQVALQSLAGSPAASSLDAKLDSTFTFQLSPALLPVGLNGQGTFAVAKSTGKFSDLSGVAANLIADATSTEIKQLEIGVTQAGAKAGNVRAFGPFDSTKREGKLTVEINSIDRRVLNLLAATAGLDFSETTINSTNEVEITKSGNVISVFGDFNVAKLRLSRDGQSTPTVNLNGDYNLAVDQTTRSALLGSLKISGTQNNRPFLTASLTSPMTITWGKSGDTAGNSTFTFTLSDLNMAEWKPVFGRVAQTGIAQISGKVSAQDDGKLLNYELKATADSMTVIVGSNRVERLNFVFDAAGESRELRHFKITDYGAQVFQAGQPAFSFQGTANYDITTNALTKALTNTADAEISMLCSLPQVASAFKSTGADVSSGALEARGRWMQRSGTNLFAGKVRLVDLTAKMSGLSFERFSSDVDVELPFDSQRLQIRKASGTLAEANKAGGKFIASGNVNLATHATDLSLLLTNVNQFGLRPFLEPNFGGKKLATVTLNSTAAIGIAANGDLTLKADAAITNLVATDHRVGTSTPPLDLRLRVDTTLGTNSVQLRQCAVTFTPIGKAKNQLALTGSVDFSNTNAITGNIKLSGESLDLTRLYDLTSGPAQPSRPGQPSETGGGAVFSQKEPEPIHTKFKDLNADLSFNRIMAREIEMTNVQVHARLDGSRLVLKPCSLTLNGAPVKTTLDLDLGVPGYRYDFTFDAQSIPIAPLVNTFMPERRGHMTGSFTGAAAIKGEGITGANLQTNLTGQITCLSTNLNLSIANSKSPLISVLVNTVIGIPELLKNPLAPFENLVGRLVNFRGQKDGWTDQLMDAPIQVIALKIEAGGGRVKVPQAEVHSSAFKANTAGDIVLARTLTNSTISFPVHVSLNRSLSEKIGLVASDDSSKADYYAMPDFFKMRGTIGKPERDINKLALAGFAAQTGASIIQQIPGNAGKKASDLLQSGAGIIKNLLGGGNPQTPPGTNAPAKTNAGPFDLFK